MVTHLKNESSSVVLGVIRFLWPRAIRRKRPDLLSYGVSDIMKTESHVTSNA